MTDKKAFILRIDPKLYELMHKDAEKDGRSINQQVTYYIRQALAVRPT